MSDLLSVAEWHAKAKGLNGTSPGGLVKQYTAEIIRTPCASDESRVRTFRITTGNPDREGDTVSPAGWKLENYRRNPTVLWAHDYKGLPIGKALEIRQHDGGLDADVEFAPKELYPFADTVLGLVDFGALKATSVGFDPVKFVENTERRAYDFIEQELLEFSIVPVPANAEALQLAKKGLAARFEPYTAWVERAYADLKQMRGCTAGNACPNTGRTAADCGAKDCPMRERRSEGPPRHYVSLEAFFRETAPVEPAPPGYVMLDDFLAETEEISDAAAQ